jgi:hypothetical protein
MAPLAMARPTKRPESSSHQFRKRVPANILKRFAGQKLTVELPSATQGGQPLVIYVTLGKADLKFSLRTSDPTLARLRNGAATEQLESRFRALKDGPKPLRHKQTVYLAGLVYRAMAEGFEDDPGPARDWEVLPAREAALELPPEKISPSDLENTLI